MTVDRTKLRKVLDSHDRPGGISLNIDVVYELLAELEQAERERDEALRTSREEHGERLRQTQKRAEAEAQLAKVPALERIARAASELVAGMRACDGVCFEHLDGDGRPLVEALAAFEQEQKP